MLRVKNYVSCSLHGCRYGLVSQNGSTRGRPIVKPWKIASTCPDMLLGLDLRCASDSLRPCLKTGALHVPCQGRDSQLSEEYTDRFVSIVHTWVGPAPAECGRCTVLKESLYRHPEWAHGGYHLYNRTMVLVPVRCRYQYREFRGVHRCVQKTISIICRHRRSRSRR